MNFLWHTVWPTFWFGFATYFFLRAAGIRAESWVCWGAYQIGSIVGWILGWPLVISALIARAWSARETLNPLYAPRTVTAWTWRWMLPWGNEEDGIVPPPTVNGKPYWPRAPRWWRILMWTCWRNGVNNMRLLPGAMIRLDAPPTVSRLGSVTLCTYGWRQCLIVGRFRMGWLLRPEAVAGDYAWPIIAPE